MATSNRRFFYASGFLFRQADDGKKDRWQAFFEISKEEAKSKDYSGIEVEILALARPPQFAL